MARYNEEVFQCQCPVYNCNNTEPIPWHHCGDPTKYKLYISDEAKIRCESCGMISPFFENKYDCGKHDDIPYSVRFRYPTDLKKVLTIIGILEDDGIYSSDFVYKLSTALEKQFNNKNRQKYAY